MASIQKKRAQGPFSSCNALPSKAARSASSADCKVAASIGRKGRPMDPKTAAEDGTVIHLHAEYDKCIARSRETLDKLHKILCDPENAKFCSERQRQEWSNEIIELTNQKYPEAIIGCLGASGAGKSSLLNALLNESEILPTSGSRGCTASVVELRFNQFFANPVGEAAVYRGVIEFISLREWHDELESLLDECSHQEVIHHRAPDDEDTAAAWAKINQVYGHGMMESFAGQAKASAWERLSQDSRIIQLLTGKDENEANGIVVEAGVVNATKAKDLLEALPNSKCPLRRAKRKWAKEFRTKINDFVYRKGKGKEPQTWPLIRKVALYGPWPVLSTGACLVDLPGVRDANAARAKVADRYLQNCDKIWIVAPIKRAVDDKTAKDLLGAQFKRRLVMDGQYGNVSFICTHSDDCDTAEIMSDHEDVVNNVEGRWEKMIDLQNQIDAVEKKQGKLNQNKWNLEEELEETNADSSGDSDGEEDDPAVRALRLNIKAVEKEVKVLDHEYQSGHRRLNAIAATVRNEYSTKRLQKDFRAGLEELFRKPDEEEMDESCDVTVEKAPPPLPHDYQLEVHCISSKDYLKLQGLKNGPPSTFMDAEDTQIPSLRAAVHMTTAPKTRDFASELGRLTKHLLKHVKLFATEKDSHATGQQCQRIFERAGKAIDMTLIATEFVRAMESTVHDNLRPAMQAGAKKGGSAVTGTVASWSDKKNCRTSQGRSQNQNGLHWKTYEATLRHNGVFMSRKAGVIDLNQELCEPAEDEYVRNWHHTMHCSIKVLLKNAYLKVKAIYSKAINALVKEFEIAGIDSSHAKEIGDNAMRGCAELVERRLKQMENVQAATQRELSRSLMSRVGGRMSPGYQSASNVARGPGFEKRMHNSLEVHVKQVRRSMFEEAVGELLDDVQNLICSHQSALMGLTSDISQSLHKSFSVTWTDEVIQMDSKAKIEAISCRYRLRCQFSGLLIDHEETLGRMRVKPDTVDLTSETGATTTTKPPGRIASQDQTYDTSTEMQPDSASSMMPTMMNDGLARGAV